MSRTRTPALLSTAGLVAALLGGGAPAHSAEHRATGPANPGFETGDLSGWKVVGGDAFSDRAVSSEDAYWGGPFHQQGTHHLWGHAAAGDEAQGELASSTFEAPARMSFLVAGGWDPERLYVALVRDSDGKELVTQTGMDDEAYVRIQWDTSAWQGEPVHLKVVDRKSGSGEGAWAHINLDDVRTENTAQGEDGLTYRPLGQANQPRPDQPGAADYAADPLRPQYHYTPYQGWINDPNGVIKWKGRHHLFAQYYPGAPKWGPMHWTHADSPDAVHWQQRPVALTPPPPSTPGDQSGIFSGSAVDDDGTLTVAYTRFTDTAANPGATPETVEMATSTNGSDFTPVSGNPVIPQPPPGSDAGFRDPKVFKDPLDDKWKMAVGSGHEGRGKVHLYASDDLRDWSYTGVLAEGESAETGAMWECPDLFRLGDKWVLLYSTNEGGQSLQRYAVGDYDGTTFDADRHGVLDGGGDTYAAQSYQDDDGRRLMVAWMSDWSAKEPTRVNGWAGAQSIHRELFLTDEGKLGQRPVAEVAELATGDPVTTGPRTVTEPWKLGSARTARLRTELDIGASTADTFALRLHSSSAEGTELRYEKSTGTLTLDTTDAGYGTARTWSTTARPDKHGILRLDILLDRSSVEVFAGDGAALTARVHPRYEESQDIVFTTTGGDLRLRSTSRTPLGSSWTS
ncbi:GH32 C-terminal domain-containing protein [Streptomyces sp. N2-109]|uniref:beta-fructofuranosidase n=1 Tax=Streptomyces gossypii TaxID=2883101 RepID=A0ABT2JX06_9ACTN|nr:GH32 C-terminal domain-containing protein [Streptomyces gossypii]MCT2592427.1 GH32 C-terminal domain-containing protein [Streptomyces gossypii]